MCMIKKNLRLRAVGLWLLFVLFGMFVTGCGAFGDPNRVIPLTPVATGGQSTVKDEPAVIEFDYPSGDPRAEYGEHLVPPTTDFVKPIGRTAMLDEVRWCGQSGSGVGFVFVGRRCDVTLCSDGSMGDAAPRIGIWVDNEKVMDFPLEQDITLNLITCEADTAADIRIVKLSECAESTFGIGSFDVDGMMLPLTSRERKIEFIGDSITCGYGVDGNLGEVFSTATEDCTKAYACQTAQILNAEYSLVCCSGFGIVSGYTGTGEKLPDKTLPQYYEKMSFTYGNGFAGNIDPSELDWNFSDFVPDTIVINLGTNDFSYCGADEERCREYTDGYREFLKMVRRNNPDAYIVCTLGTMGAELFECMEQAVSEYSEETGDTNIATFCFEEQNQQTDGIGIDWHPSAQTQWKAAQALADFLLGHYGE